MTPPATGRALAMSRNSFVTSHFINDNDRDQRETHDEAFLTIARSLYRGRRRDTQRPGRLDVALERQGPRRLDDVDVAAGGDLGGAGAGARRDGRYTEPIGSGRDPLKVFTVAADVDGRPAIRISGEAFGELRTKRSFENYHLKFQFKWGEKKWPPRDRAETPRDSGLLYTSTRHPGRTDGPGRARSSCRSRNTTSAISMPWARPSRCARNSGREPSRRFSTTTLPANGCSSRRPTASRAAPSNSRTPRSRTVNGTRWG